MDEKPIDLNNVNKFYKIKSAKKKLSEILVDILDMGIVLTNEINAIIVPYIPKHENTDSDQDINSDIDILSNSEDLNNIVLETTETNESNEISSSFEDLKLVG
ncbi:hypothetical protein [Rickettsia endosymbiont of Orchestes rusci]|uniref:hypothetical protein n=1 Tax=Rickettsia endosymbiont of Orchestes rusci TaxID=3066250 RepID=UPI00313DE4E0